MRVKRQRPRGLQAPPPPPCPRPPLGPRTPRPLESTLLLGNVEGLPDVNLHGTTFNSCVFPGIINIINLLDQLTGALMN